MKDRTQLAIILLSAAFYLYCVTAKAETVTVDAQSPIYQTAVEAAKVVSVGFSDTQAEMAAVIVETATGGFVYSTITVQQHDSFSLKLAFPREDRLVAIVHSHPGTDALAAVFSPQDLNVADSLQVTSCIRFVATKEFRCYFPGRTATHRISAYDKFGVKTSTGDAV